MNNNVLIILIFIFTQTMLILKFIPNRNDLNYIGYHDHILPIFNELIINK